MQGMDVYLKVVTSIPGIDSHDANAVHSFFPILHFYFHNLYFSNPSNQVQIIKINQKKGKKIIIN